MRLAFFLLLDWGVGVGLGGADEGGGGDFVVDDAAGADYGVAADAGTFEEHRVGGYPAVFTYLYLAGLDFDADPLLAKPMVVVENPDTGTNQRAGTYPYPSQAAYHAVAVHVDTVANLELSVAIDLYVRAG